MKYFLIITTLIFFLLKLTRCQVIFNVIDKSKYCPNGPNNKCKNPAEHVVCKYYDPNKKLGPACKHYREHKITAAEAEKILKKFNAIRGRVATGKETGKGGKLLPRGYGIKRLIWSSELAALAQIVVDNCEPKNYYDCASTNIFTNPIQAARPINKWDGFDVIDEGLEFFEKFKHVTTEAHIHKCPDLISDDKESDSKRYLKIINGEATHVGCAVSFSRSPVVLSQFTCYFSHWTPTSEPVYNTVPPKRIPGTAHYANECGCPKGHRASQDCLCVLYKPLSISTLPAHNTLKKKLNTQLTGPTVGPMLENEPWPETNPRTVGSKQSIALLPIFQISNAKYDGVPHYRRYDNLDSVTGAKSPVKIITAEEKTEEIPGMSPAVTTETNINNMLLLRQVLHSIELNKRKQIEDKYFPQTVLKSAKPNTGLTNEQDIHFQKIFITAQQLEDIEEDFEDLKNYQKNKADKEKLVEL